MISPKNNKIRLVVYFDGVCNLCNFWVKWIRKIDRKSRFELRSLQSAEGKEFIKKYQMESGLAPDSVVYCRVKNRVDLNLNLETATPSIDNSQSSVDDVFYQVYFESNAILYILKDSGFLGKVGFGLLWLIPPFIRNSMYQWIARNRYRWFGKCDL